MSVFTSEVEILRFESVILSSSFISAFCAVPTNSPPYSFSSDPHTAVLKPNLANERGEFSEQSTVAFCNQPFFGTTFISSGNELLGPYQVVGSELEPKFAVTLLVVTPHLNVGETTAHLSCNKYKSTGDWHHSAPTDRLSGELITRVDLYHGHLRHNVHVFATEFWARAMQMKVIPRSEPLSRQAGVQRCTYLYRGQLSLVGYRGTSGIAAPTWERAGFVGSEKVAIANRKNLQVSSREICG
ncbi:hypothetical protein J6590_055524 [Homalodisca vitripennis]|nr:hypothetical protein J6590_055524 [Homalodisca vitripennis]